MATEMDESVIEKLTFVYLQSKDIKSMSVDDFVKTYADIHKQVIDSVNRQELF